jgi:DNA-binding MarR family transcriptional regulator
MDKSPDTVTLDALATGLAADLERIFGLFRSLVPPSGGLSMTAATTLARLERAGPQRLTDLAAREGVTQPAMTQLITRLEEAGLARREASPADGRVVLVAITEAGRETLSARRAVRGERLGAVLAGLSQEHRDMLAAALPALDALAGVPRYDEPARLTGSPH